ncbi:MAG: 3-hydroxyacyl-CoA dehydrogenase NAD-binding domain-containing protein [Planctomycetota bacterium]|nr:3-hydroxyacyl-CoA dehydrogenase NAD-binding domain-containing protein [Planctomycetota bacterium]
MSQWKLIRSSSWEGPIPQADPAGRWLHLVIDAESSANVLSAAVLEDLDKQLDRVSEFSNVDALIISSAKNGHFIAGADVNAIGSADNVDHVIEACRSAQDLFGRLSNLSIPSIAVIQGTCLGGGLELSLGCTARIAVQDPRTRIGLPEVNLGIIPGFGGTVRMTRLLGLRGALGWILPASRLPAQIAHRKGVVDASVPVEGFRALSLQMIEAMVSDGFRKVNAARKKRRKGWISYFLDETSVGRTIVCRQALKTVRARTLGLMPAPERAIEVARLSAHRPEKEALLEEARAVSRLATGPVCRNLVAIFQDSERVRRGVSGQPDGVWPEPRTLVVLGAGVMGSGVATMAIEKSIPTRLRDISEEAIDQGLKKIGKAIDTRRKKRRITTYQQAEILSRLSHGKELVGLERCGGVLEAVVERLDVKRSVLAEIAPLLAQDAIFATNTSALSVTAIQKDSPVADRVVGLHFFNPVPKMPLVEVIPGEFTAPEAVGIALSLARKLGKYPVIVKDSPGFLVNRLLLPYLDAASRLLLKGLSGSHIDQVARTYGLPMGPFRLMDEVGLDIGVEVQETLHCAFGDRAASSPILMKMVEKGWLGKKSGIGFYQHSGNSSTWNRDLEPMVQATASTLPATQIISSLLDPMIDEAARCLEEEVVADAGLLDLAMVMGTGYPPHLGGPLRAADAEGLPAIEERLRAAHENGAARSPCKLLVDLALINGRFHSRT